MHRALNILIQQAYGFANLAVDGESHAGGIFDVRAKNSAWEMTKTLAPNRRRLREEATLCR
jgi:hypothetical protein